MIETTWNQFMHIYFWVFLCGLIVLFLSNLIDEDESKKKEKLKGLNFWSIVGLTLWIMSFKY